MFLNVTDTMVTSNTKFCCFVRSYFSFVISSSGQFRKNRRKGHVLVVIVLSILDHPTSYNKNPPASHADFFTSLRNEELDGISMPTVLHEHLVTTGGLAHKG